MIDENLSLHKKSEHKHKLSWFEKQIIYIFNNFKKIK